ncbi:unnamed protein product [Phyllotreta striolata]|uniref:aralkylamine N-acetyltransferase n=1 Tax=Phyllotreta striolata TaxID=444603 RepID=A0A9N9TQF2_PHYSR|nr:unnamed protein product [Phyllotreta striolata]
MSPTLAYEIKPVTEENRQEITDFLRTVFFKEEPLNAYLELITEENQACPTLEEFTLRHLDDGVNLMAVRNNEIIGICLCVAVEKGVTEPFDCENEKYNKIVEVLDYAERQCDPFEVYPECVRGVAVQVISVKESCTGRGIAAHLIREACKIAGERKFEFMNITCTGLYSAKLAAKLNFDLKYTLNYSDYQRNGIVVFKPQLPHTSINVYLKKL